MSQSARSLVQAEKSPLEFALEYNAAGWPVFPCRHAPEEVVDAETGEIETRGTKTPLLPNGLKGATKNTALVGRIFERYPSAMVGVPTGPDIGAWVLDIDVPPGHVDGRIWLAEMEQLHGKLPETRMASTASGGLHYYWKHKEGVRNRASVAPGVDTRGEGGFVIAPGSVMQDGRHYEWLNHTEICDAPDWLLELVLPRAASHGPTQPFSYQSGTNDRYIDRAVDAELSVLASAGQGGRGSQVNASAYALGQLVGAGALSRSDAESALYSAAVANGVVAKDGEREIMAKIRRGLDAGMTKPRSIPEPQEDNTRLVNIDRMISNGLAKKSLKAGPEPMPAANDNKPQAAASGPGLAAFSIFDWPASKFVGDPPKIVELVEGVIPQGVPAMIAAMGDTGKSYAALELHRRVAFGSGQFERPILGGRVIAKGTSVFVTTEDDAGEVHRRLAAIDARGHRFGEEGAKMIVVPLPSAGGPQVFWRDDRRHGLVETDAWRRLCDQLASISDLRVVTLDPLASFAHVQLNEDPAAGAFVCASLGRLATETQATTFVLHHMRKVAKPIESLADAREAIRGSTALVDGLRLAYALWPADEPRGKRVCNDLGVEFTANKVVLGGVVKANGASRRIVSTYVRNEHGLLVDRTADIGASAPAQDDLLDALVGAISSAAAAGQPYTRTGSTGLYTMRERLPVELRGLSRHRLESLIASAIEGGSVLLCLASGTVAKWLDVPGGDFAIGLGNFRKGGAWS